METKPLLYGLIGFFIGGLLVSIAATTFDKPEPSRASDGLSHSKMIDCEDSDREDEHLPTF